MDFSSAIDKIMPEVRNGSDEPFIIYHDKDGGWHGDFTQNQYGDTFDWVEDVKEQDPLALMFKGSDFANGSFAYVYDKVLTTRLRAEYNEIQYGETNLGEFQALLCFCEENIGDFSSDITDYLMKHDRPLSVLYDMLPISLKSIDNDYDTDKTEEVFELIERQFVDIKSRDNDEIKAGYSYKRNIEGYEEITSIQLAGRIVVLAENKGAENPYMVCNIKWDNPLGAEERYDGAVTNDYLEAISEFIDRQTVLMGDLKDERTPGFPFQKLTDEYCTPGGLDMDLEGKVIIIKPEALSPEYREASHQLKIAMSGFGCAPDSRGNAVYCKDLYSGKERRFERYDVLGVADIKRLPTWAKVKLAALETSKEPANEPQKRTKNAEKKPSLLEKLDDNKQKVERDKADRNNKPVTKKPGDLEVN